MPEKKIGNRTFRANKLNAVDSSKLLMRLGKVFGPGLKDIGKVFTARQAGDKAAESEAILESVMRLMAENDADEVVELIGDVLASAEVMTPGQPYEPCRFSMHFDDNILDAYRVAAFVLEVNYVDFLGGALEGALTPSETAPTEH